MAAIQVSRWNELSELYARAQGLDSAERGILLIELALQGHPLLPALRRLLDAPAHRPLEEGFTPTGRGAALYTFRRLPRRSEPARCIGHYRLQQPLSSNAAAETWLAHRADDTAEQTMIVKRLVQHHRNPAPAAAFMRRAHALRQGLAALRPLGVVGAADTGIGADGHPWLAVAPVEGEPITLHCDRLRLPLQARLQLMRRVLAAMARAHAQGLVHGDLSPANVLIGADGGLRICAFGIAPLEREWSGGAALPELADDARALGGLLYELLCGRSALPPVGSSVDGVAGVTISLGPVTPSRQHADADVAAARGLTPPALQRALAGSLDKLAMRAIGMAPAARFADARGLLDAVDRCLAEAAQPAFGQPDTPAPAGRRSRGLWLALAALMAVVAFSAAALWRR